MEDIEDPFIDSIAKDKNSMFIYKEIPINIMTTKVNDNTPVYDHTHFDVSFSNERYQLVNDFDPLLMKVDASIADGDPLYSYTTEVIVNLTLDSPYKFEDGTKTYTGRFNIVAKDPQKYWNIAVKANNCTKLQGAADPVFTSSIVENDDNSPYYYDGSTPGFSGTMTREPGEGSGTYNILQGTLEFADNGKFLADYYNMNFIPGELTIDAAPSPSYTTFNILSHTLSSSEFTIQEDDLTIDLSTQLQLTIDNYTSFRPDGSDDSGIDSKVTVTSKDITGDYYTAEVQCNSFYMIGDILYITVEYKLLNYDLNMATGGVRLERQVQFTISNKYYYSQTCQETIYINIEKR